MEPRSFVRVVVRLEDGGEAFGTGYRLSRERVLTARHVVGEADSVQVELDREDGSLCRVAAEVLWRGEKDLDAAVLACEPDVAAPNAFTRLAREPLGRTQRRESRGSALAVPEGRCVGDSMAALSGKAFRGQAHEDRLELSVEAPPKKVEHWGGISGAPVFVGDWIAGVVREAPRTFDERFYAVPAHRLLADDGFARAVGLAEAEKWTGRLAEIHRLLRDDLEAGKALAEQEPSWEKAFAKGSEELATALERSAVSTVLQATHNAHRALVAAGRTAAARTVEKVLERIVPVLYDRQLVYSLPGAPGGVVLQPRP